MLVVRPPVVAALAVPAGIGDWVIGLCRVPLRVGTVRAVTMRYASLPETTSVEQAEVHRSTRHLRAVSARIERVLGERSFRLWALLTLNALDLLTTAAVLALGGTESNPAMQGVVEHWWKPIVVKAVVLGLMWLVVLRTPVTSRLADLGLLLAWVFYAGVVLWNTLLLVNY